MIFVTGDTHGDVRRFNTDNFPQQKEMCRDDYVIILGDFGVIWSGTKEEEYWLDWLDKKSFTTLFIDGNHENFDLLKSYPVVDYHGGKAHKIRDNVYHLMRGYVFDIDGKNIFAFGGARSHDVQDGILDPEEFDSMDDFRKVYRKMRNERKMFRVKNVSWWEREMPSDEELERGRKSLEEVNYEVDFVISHTAPQAIISLIGYSDVDKLSSYFNEILYDLKFTKWYFGHYHDNRALLGKMILLYEMVIQIA